MRGLSVAGVECSIQDDSPSAGCEDFSESCSAWSSLGFAFLSSYSG